MNERTLKRTSRETIAAAIGLLTFLSFCGNPLSCWATEPAEPTPGTVFATKLGSVLGAKCVSCHRPDNLQGNLNLTTREGMLAGGDLGSSLSPGKPEESPLYTRAISHDGQPPEMPEEGEPLTTAEADSLRAWISAGSPWPENLVLKEPAKADGSFWSFRPLSIVEPPIVVDSNPAWSVNPIDRFVWAKLRASGLTPNEPADPATLIRRATYDLIGLPPTPDEVAMFEREWHAEQTSRVPGSPTAYERLIDRLLASPHYGERWGRHWLDVIRFGESRGYERNEIVTNIWPFRDYVIRSFNEDKPFDQLVREHLAGDVIGRGQPDVEIGSAFLVAGPYDDVGNQNPEAAAQIRADQMDEMVRATGEGVSRLDDRLRTVS